MTTPDTSTELSDMELSIAERRLPQAVVTGALVDLQVKDADLDDPKHGAAWGPGRAIRATVLAELLTGQRASQGGRPRAVKLRGARVTGLLDLEGSTLFCPLLLEDCHFEEQVNLNEATAVVIRMPGCHLPGLTADQLKTTGNLELNRGFTARGEVRLRGAHIGGHLNLRGASLINRRGRALSADLLTVDQNLYCLDGFTAEGQVRLRGARIRGQVHLSGAELTNPSSGALLADVLTVDQSFLCGDGDPFVAKGEVRLRGARIGGVLDLSHASLTKTDGPDGVALGGEGLNAGYGIWCRDNFTAHGKINLNGARTGGVLDLNGARLTNPDGPVLFADGLNAEYGMHCGRGFTAHGEVRVATSRIGGKLDLSDATLANPEGVALNLEAANLAALLLPKQRPDGAVNLTNARVGAFTDDPASWPKELQLRGFVYDTLEHGDTRRRDRRQRLQLLKRHPGRYTPQIYDQLAATYRKAGREEAARKVAIAKQWRRRTAIGPAGKFANWLLYLTVGYGYRTWLAGVWLAGLTGLGTWVFSNAYPAHMIATRMHPPAFHAFAYTLNVLLPIVDLGQKSAWQAQGSALYWSWALTGAGWVLTTAVVAGLTGVLKRD
jgi:hypothetical protein